MRSLANKGRLAAWLLVLPLGGCSYLSTLYVAQDASKRLPSETQRQERACIQARSNMIAARDPLEARRWETLRADLGCVEEAEPPEGR
ncbi:hypothetical protein [Pararhodospirillum photometricum]|uniref:Uncharacterized protein n=1 Tax=Pararhodospirillum photometricum DSM 122 TaxID=1150469 RepID=H6SR21_PARPM|nr:hypothetical protein [Pararhodospirillum photometricum]CCG09743.1 unnamed protein product [Pararhodospirillum photometricum DSM 122]